MLEHDDLKYKYVPHSIANDLNELGYREPCSAYYIIDTLVIIGVDINTGLYVNTGTWYSNKGAPTYDEVIEWLMKEHGFYAFVEPKISWPDNYVSGCEWHNHIFCGNGKDDLFLIRPELYP
jgi:hypothetical protein